MNICRTLVMGATVGGALLALPAQASTISYTDITPGSSLYSSGGVVVSALKNGSSSTFGIKCNGGNDAAHCGMGVNGGPAGQEIDASENDSILFDYSALGGVYIDSFQLTLLYNGPEWGDALELALVRINGGADYLLSLTGEDTATWSFAGASVLNCAATTEQEGGCFNVSNPFSSTLVNSMQFYALSNGNYNDSDYAVSSVTASVPEPATLGLLGLGLAAVGLARRRRSVG